MESVRSILCVLALGGCGDSDEPAVKPSPKTWVRLETFDGSLAGADVILGGQRERLSKPRPTDGVRPGVGMSVPGRLAANPTIDLELQTPCEIRRLRAVSVIEENHGDSVKVRISVNEVDRVEERTVVSAVREGAVVQIGKAVIDAPLGSLRDSTCRASHDVRIGGKVVGTVKVAKGKDDRHTILISDDPKACFRFRTIGYGDQTGGGETMLSGSQVYVMSHWGDPDHVFQPAPENAAVGRKGTGTSRTELMKVPCPAAPAGTP